MPMLFREIPRRQCSECGRVIRTVLGGLLARHDVHDEQGRRRRCPGSRKLATSAAG